MSSPNALPAGIRCLVMDAVAEASAVVREELAQMRIELKADGTPVTSVDLAVERVIRARIEKAFPEHGIVGEEYGVRNPDAPWTWLIDPIDGTRQFAAGLPNYGILIALCEGATPRAGVICQPQLGDLYLGIYGEGASCNGTPIRVAAAQTLRDAIVCFSDPDAFHGSDRAGLDALRALSRWNIYDGGCLSFAALAAGRVGACLYGPNIDDYDFCALVPIVEEAGGILTDWDGRRLTRKSRGPILASCSKAIHDVALEALSSR